jgi:hypothetical protein
MADADEKVNRLILRLLHGDDPGWKGGYEPPEHFRECPDVTVAEAEVNAELWFDTGVEAVRLTARLSCPHRPDVEWEWADLGELSDLIEEMD